MKEFFSSIICVLIFLYDCAQPKEDISKIKFYADYCYGTCPVFEITINNDRNASYKAIEYNKLEGLFNATIEKPQFDSLLLLISEANLFSLKNGYNTQVTDLPTYTLTVKLKNGQTKTIIDYGPAGPKKLLLVYEKFFLLRESQAWK